MDDLKTEVIVAILNKVLESEDIVSSDSSMKEMREDAHNKADIVHLYTEAILDKFTAPRIPERTTASSSDSGGIKPLDVS